MNRNWTTRLMRLAAGLMVTTVCADCPPIDTCPWDLNQTHHIQHEPVTPETVMLYQLMLHEDGSFSMQPMEPQAPPMNETASHR